MQHLAQRDDAGVLIGVVVPRADCVSAIRFSDDHAIIRDAARIGGEHGVIGREPRLDQSSSHLKHDYTSYVPETHSPPAAS